MALHTRLMPPQYQDCALAYRGSTERLVVVIMAVTGPNLRPNQTKYYDSLYDRPLPLALPECWPRPKNEKKAVPVQRHHSRSQRYSSCAAKTGRRSCCCSGTFYSAVIGWNHHRRSQQGSRGGCPQQICWASCCSSTYRFCGQSGWCALSGCCC